MGYRLAPTLSYCCTEGQRIFLDTKRDRYFCLVSGLEASFERWATGQPLSPPDLANVTKLAAERLLVETSGPDVRPAARSSPDPPRISLFDRAVRADRLSVFTAYARFQWAGARLALFGLAASLVGLERHKRQMRRRPDAEAAAQQVANAFRGAGLYATTRLHCLSHSIAVAHALLAQGAPALLVIGVRTRPFGAHAWVQLGELVVNDSIDNVRDFTPIRLV